MEEILKKWREAIDDLDQQIVFLLEQRFEYTQKIGQYKQQEGVSVLQTQREQQVFDQIKKNLKNKAYDQDVVEIWQCIMQRSKQQQIKLKSKQEVCVDEQAKTL